MISRFWLWCMRRSITAHLRGRRRRARLHAIGVTIGLKIHNWLGRIRKSEVA